MLKLACPLDKEKDRDGKSINIFVYPNSFYLEGGIVEPVQMTVAGTMSYTGKLWNLTCQFSKEQFYFSEGSTDPSIIKFKLTPSKDVVPGNYTLTGGARYETIAYSEIPALNIK
jgi:hypothetical protein